jgi:eukaryotic-like serine/threonine-protein kinase
MKMTIKRINLIWIFILGFTIFGLCEDKKETTIKKEKPELAVTCPDGMVKIPARYLLHYPVFYKVDWQEETMDAFCIDQYEYPNKKGEFPLVDVTFEKAESLCKEQGKRICSYYEWLSACQGSKNYKYPYGLIYDSQKCNTHRGMIFFESERTLASSGDFPECKSDFGVYDMTGNVWEWSKNQVREKEKGIESERELRGGGWDSGYACMDSWSQLKKRNIPETFLDDISEIKDRIGFRCCKSLAK